MGFARVVTVFSSVPTLTNSCNIDENKGQAFIYNCMEMENYSEKMLHCLNLLFHLPSQNIYSSEYRVLWC